MRSRRVRLLLALLVLTSLTLIVLSLRSDSAAAGPLRAIGNAIFSPLQRAVTAVVTPIGDFFSGITGWQDAEATIAELRAENDRLRTLVEQGAEDRARAAELDALLRLAGAGQYRVVPAEVVAIGPVQGFAWTVSIDAGSRDGIEVDMTVVNGAGLVGRIVSVGESSSIVALVVDASTSIGGRIAASQEIGIVSGTGRQDQLQMQLLDPLAAVEPGTAVVTFGSQGGRPYAPGVPIGVVTEVRGQPGQLTRVALLAPYVDVSTLDLVGVVVEPPRVDDANSHGPGTHTDTDTDADADADADDTHTHSHAGSGR